MSGAARNWDDLKTRMVTGLVLSLVATAAVWAGTGWFLALATLATGLLFWELAKIVDVGTGPLPVLFALAGGMAICVMEIVKTESVSWAVMSIFVVFAIAARRLRYVGTIYAWAIVVAALTLVSLHENFGPVWLLWLVLVVIASDVAGYLAGRTFGGPKFWPRVSPKKTWSGTVAGWIAAGAVGAIMAPLLGTQYNLIFISMALAFAGQLGDIAESALKRQAGIKDSSNILPGHGGVLDRLDALIGASIGFLLFQGFIGLPG